MVVNPLDEIVTQENAEFNLALLSSTTGFENRQPVHSYSYDAIAGEGQHVYVVDTGVFVEHEEFEGVSFSCCPLPPHLKINKKEREKEAHRETF